MAEEETEARVLNTVVIQPGSRNLKIGRSCDARAQICAHAVAIRNTDPPSTDPPTRERNKRHAEKEGQINMEAMETLAKELKNTFLAPVAGARSFIPKNNPPSDEAPDAEEEDEDDWTWTDVRHAPRKVFGDAALRIHPSEPYQVFYPLRYNQIAIEPGRLRQHSVDMLEDLWRWALTDVIKVPKFELATTSVVLVIPCGHSRHDVKTFVDILLNKIGVARLLVHQDTICACLAAGVSTACVVDIGHSMTTVCCVDDCMVLPKTCFTLPVGGKTVTRFLNRLTGTIGLNGSCTLDQRKGAMDLTCVPNEKYLDELKSDQAHFFERTTTAAEVMNAPVAEVEVQGILFSLPPYPPDAKGVEVVHHSVPISAFFVSPMALLRLKTVGLSTWLTGEKDPWKEFRSLLVQRHDPCSPNDPDDHLIGITEVRKDKPATTTAASASTTAAASTTTAAAATTATATTTPAPPDDPTKANNGATNPPPAQPAAAAPTPAKRQSTSHSLPKSQALLQVTEFDNLEDAILESIKCALATNPEIKERLFGSIVICGGGAMLPGCGMAIETVLSERVKELEPPPQILVLNIRRADPICLSWLGGAVIANIEASRDLWITKQEWSKAGGRAIRERAAFVW